MAIWIKALEAQPKTEALTPASHPELFAEKGHMTLAALQEKVGGYVQVIYLRKPITLDGADYTIMAMNEDGKVMDMAVNTTASMIAHMTGSIAASDCIVGDALLLSSHELA